MAFYRLLKISKCDITHFIGYFKIFYLFI